MNDNETTTLVKQSFAAAQMNAPLDEVVRRGRVFRGRRRAHRLIGVTSVAAGAAVAAAMLVPGGHAPGGHGAPPGRSPRTQIKRSASS